MRNFSLNFKIMAPGSIPGAIILSSSLRTTAAPDNGRFNCTAVNDDDTVSTRVPFMTIASKPNPVTTKAYSLKTIHHKRKIATMIHI